MSTTAVAVRSQVGALVSTGSEYESDFTEAYEKYYTRVFAFVYSRVRDVELSKDIVSDVFERAYRKGEGVRDKAAYRGWLFAIAKNLISGHYRKQKSELRKQDRATEQLRFTDDYIDPEWEAVRNDRASALMALVSQASERDQELISLKFDAELTHDEIAKIMKMSAGTVRVAIFRALKRLKALAREDLALVAA